MRRRQRATEPIRERNEQPVTHIMAEAVVDSLEAIEIDETHSDPVIGTGDHEVTEPFQQQRAIRQAGEWVMKGL